MLVSVLCVVAMEDADGGVVVNVDEVTASHDERRLQRLRSWLWSNGVQLRGCDIRRSGGDAGLGVFASQDKAQGVMMVAPLLLAITPTTVMQDPEVGAYFMQLMAEGDVDDRLLIILFLVIERARGQLSFWAPWLDVMPTKFGTTICFSEEEVSELKGTNLFQATRTRVKSLKSSFEELAKPFAEMVLSNVESERREIEFQDFLWANSIFWARAKNIPCPRSVVFPAQPAASPSLQSGEMQLGNTPSTGLQLDGAMSESSDVQIATNDRETCSLNESTLDELGEEISPGPSLADENDMGNAPTDQQLDGAVSETIDCQIATNYMETSSEREFTPLPSLSDDFDMGVSETSTDRFGILSEAENDGVINSPSVYVEGVVPGIDFCNHDRYALALWEVDGPEGSVTGVPNSMYLVTLRPEPGVPLGEEIYISYGPKSNEELLFLYGFVLDDNPDDYLMIYFPIQALEDSDCSSAKKQLLEQLNLPLRWLLPSSELKRGFNEEFNLESTIRNHPKNIISGHSWTGQRKTSTLANKVVFPEDLLTALRIIAMKEEESYRVSSMLQEIADPEAERYATGEDIRAAVWEVCGNTGTFQLLVDLLTSTMMALEDGTGTEAEDAELLAKDSKARSQIKEKSHSDRINKGDDNSDRNLLPENKRACVLYRMGQKCLVRRFLQEAEIALEVCIDYVSD